MYKLLLGVRSALFWPPFLLFTMVASVFLIVLIPAPLKYRIAVVKCWVDLSLICLKVCCGLGYRIEGKENIPAGGFIIMSKHSSTWESIALQKFFNPLIWAVKKELTRIPFFGWGLIAMNAIALDRGGGRQAVKQLIEESRLQMDAGRILMLFPEGTRVLPLQKKKFKAGGALVAEKTGYAILPIAHNAGEFWPRHSWIKWPGSIRVVIGPPIDPQNQSVEQIMDAVENWIDTTCAKISDHRQLARLGVEIEPVDKVR